MITGVTVHAICRADATGKCDLLVDGVGSYSADNSRFANPGVYIELTTEWTEYAARWALNPNSSLPWTQADILNLRFGVWLWSSAFSTGQSKCTQLWVEVERDDSSVEILIPTQDWNQYGIYTENYLNLQTNDGDSSWIGYTTSGYGGLPASGGKFLFWNVSRRKLTLATEGWSVLLVPVTSPFYKINNYNFIYPNGAEVLLHAPLSVNYYFMGWDGPVIEPDLPDTSIIMDADKIAVAIYQTVPPMLNLYTYVQGQGNISTAGGTATSWGVQAPQGTVIELTAIPESGWHFDHWEGGGLDAPTTSIITITLNANNSVTAVFIEDSPPPPPPPEESECPWWILLLIAAAVAVASEKNKKKTSKGKVR